MSLSVQNSGNLPREVLEEFENVYAELRKARDDQKQLILAITTGQGSGLGGFAPPGFIQLPGTPPGTGSGSGTGIGDCCEDPGGVGVSPSDPPQGDVTSPPNALLDGNIHQDTVDQDVTKGSLIAGNDTPAWDELLVGTDGDLLTADSTAPKGMKWEAPVAGISPADSATDVSDTASDDPQSADYSTEGHWHQGVFSHNRLGSTALFGATLHEAGPGLVCYQVGQTVFYAMASMAPGYVSCANASPQDITTITFVDVIDSGLALSANTSYGFQYFGDLFTSAATEGGILSVNFSGTLTALSCTVYFPDGSSTPYTFTANDGGTLQTTGPGNVTPGAFFVYGTIQVGASGGTLMLRGRCETNPPPAAPTFEIQECLTKHVWPL